MNREFLMLAKDFDRAKHIIGGWFVSEKLDGMRALWDGGCTTGMLKTEVPWANTLKDSRYTLPQKCTGLWTRYGHVIHAPQSLINKLPKGVILDGELWAGYGKFQTTTSIVKDLEPGPGWSQIKYMVFGCPNYRQVFQDGRINNPNYQKILVNCIDWVKEHYARRSIIPCDASGSFHHERSAMAKLVKEDEQLRILEQIQLPFPNTDAGNMITESLLRVTERRGEGLILRNPSQPWTPRRVDGILKVKEMKDAEGVVIGFKTGIGKLQGLIGSLIIKWDDKILNLSGFTDDERRLYGSDAYAWATANPESELPEAFSGTHFKRGDIVTFRYRELSEDGIPKEARYWRSNNS